MQKILTPALLDRLISQGYLYCLSKTIAVVGEDADICITLAPVRDEPLLTGLPEKFDTYFEMGEEPSQMAMGIDDALIVVDLSNLCEMVEAI